MTVKNNIAFASLDTGVSLDGIDMEKVAILAAKISQSMEAQERASQPPYADMDNKRFPVSSDELAKASQKVWSKLQGKIRQEYTEEAWTSIGEEINKRVEVSTAAHNEDEDVEMVEAMMVLLRELMVRELQDGEVHGTYKLSEMVRLLEGLNYLSMMESSGAMLAEADAETDVTTAEGEDEEDMALSEEDLEKIAVTVAKATASAQADSMTSLTEVLTKLSSQLAEKTVPVAESAPVVETPAETEAAVEETATTEATPVEEEVETKEPVVEAEAETEAAKPPFLKKEDEEETDEDKKKKKAKAEADAKADAEQKALEARASIDPLAENTEDEDEISIPSSSNALAGFFDKGTSNSTGLHDLSTQEGRDAYLNAARVKSMANAGIRTESVPAGVTGGASEKSIVEKLLDPTNGIFRKI